MALTIGGETSAEELHGHDDPLTLQTLQESFHKRLVAGLPRAQAEEILRGWGCEPRYVPREDFSLNSLTTIIVPPPSDGIGALIAVTGHLEDHWLYDPFAAIVVHIGKDNNVLAAGYKILGDGP